MNNVWSLVIASAVIYGILALCMGTIPGIILSRSAPTPGLQPYSASAQRGRDIYVSEGCSYCHTQYVRPLKQDLVFGRPSVAGDFAYDTPELLGSERTGPDLTNIGARQPSAAWQYLHLWDPRSVVHDSIMPRYTWLFAVKAKAAPGDVVVTAPPAFAPAHGVIVATQRARDLVAYLKSLKQVPLTKAGKP
jgi:cytochrome c oxidase cbb3-type subunit 2